MRKERSKIRTYRLERNAYRRRAVLAALWPARVFVVVCEPFGFKWAVAARNGDNLAYCE